MAKSERPWSNKQSISFWHMLEYCSLQSNSTWHFAGEKSCYTDPSTNKFKVNSYLTIYYQKMWKKHVTDNSTQTGLFKWLNKTTRCFNRFCTCTYHNCHDYLIIVCMFYIISIFRNIFLNVKCFATGVPGEKRRRHGENWQTPKRKTPGDQTQAVRRQRSPPPCRPTSVSTTSTSS